MKIIYTLQYPQSEHHLNGRVGSWTDWDLTELGVAQAQRIAFHLKEELKDKPVRLLSSDLKRAWHTAQIVGQALNVTPEKKSGCGSGTWAKLSAKCMWLNTFRLLPRKRCLSW